MIGAIQFRCSREESTMASWVEAVQHRIGSEFDELLLSSANLYRVLTSAGKEALSKGEMRQMRSWISFYLERSYPERPATFFSIPKRAPQARVVSDRPFADGKSVLYAFPSGYRVRNPEFADYFQGFEANQTAYLFHWSHGDRGRKTIVCCHGWSLGDPAQAVRMFRVHKLFGLGLDVALFITPFHWRRASTLAQRFSPAFPFRHPVLGLEGFGQAVHDLAAAFLFLREQGASRLGLIGASLGGYLAALFVSVTRLAELVALVVPVASFQSLRVPTSRLPRGRARREESKGLQELISSLWEIHSPLSHRCRLPSDRCLIIASRGDRLCPFEDVKRLHEHWGGPEHTFLRGGHALFFPRDARGEAWYGFLKKHGFI
jgi:hypothetical protein